MTSTVLILNGPNLNLLGKRQPHIYGHETLADVEAQCRALAGELGLTLAFKQSNAEHQLIDWIHEAREAVAGIIINPAAGSGRRNLGQLAFSPGPQGTKFLITAF